MTGTLMDQVLVEWNDFAYNGGNPRHTYCRNFTFRNNWVHNGEWDGLWFDGENHLLTLTNNLFEDNLGQHITHEVSGSAEIYGNTFRRSGDSGVFISCGHDVNVYNNTFEDCYRSVNLTIDITRVGTDPGGVDPVLMEHVHVYDNIIKVPTTSGVYVCLNNPYNGTTTPYLDGTLDLTFSHNTYHVYAAQLSSAIWFWAGAKTWAQWQALGYPQDVTGSLITRT
jgi:hypothetical protein